MSSSEGEERVEKNYPHDGKPNERFSATSRIRKREDFKLIYSKGKKIVSESFALFVLGQGIGRGRLGITITKKLGKAVERNRIKRILREIFRKNKTKIQNLDIVVNARSPIREKKRSELEEEFLRMLSFYSGRNESK